MSEDLDLRTCIITGDKRTPVFVRLVKDGSFIFLDKKETVLLEIGRAHV